MISIKKSAYVFLALFLFALAAAPAFLLGEGNRNLLLIGIMGISPFLIIFYNKYCKTDIWIISFILCIIVIPLLHQPQSMRWSTVLYSSMFGLGFMAYSRLLSKSKLSIDKYFKLLKVLILAYFITLVIQQLCVLLGLPIFNISNYNPEEPWKLNSLAPEPSHSARIVALLMYSYITVKELGLSRAYNLKLDFKKDKWVWMAFIWTMLTMGSGTAFLFLPIVFLKFLKVKNILFLLPLLIGSLVLINLLGIDSFERTFKVMKATITLDSDTILKTDHSAAMRIVPYLVLIPMLKVNTIDGWFGHGIDYVGTFLSDYIYGIEEGATGGGVLALYLEYGLIVFMIYVLVTFIISYKKDDFISVIFWFLLVFMYGINSQIVWLCITVLFTNKHFFKRINILKKMNI